MAKAVKFIVLALFVVLAAGCSESQKISQLRLQNAELSKKIKSQQKQYESKIEKLKEKYESEIEKMSPEYKEDQLKAKDEQIARLKETINQNKKTIDGYAKMLIQTVGKVKELEKQLAEDNSDAQPSGDNSAANKQNATDGENTQEKLEKMKQLRQKAIEQKTAENE
ncbi:hypothetical protein L21SP3_00649 [Sedimentisphaera cyanobacteriorum]|uniref:Uncharacterized protein n=1 Tax=Sedimentisphaera cyanobacteriorum TaxID=1940790 RepID=A0A1Q2HN05_9BACT|nr:hypothetical protein [Sedimentisphaera cyanobacteriorum]AQQ08857.1 hypothetical protein L21SP3_00649 [Sedimentisphaera cyanobacteriorum]